MEAWRHSTRSHLIGLQYLTLIGQKLCRMWELLPSCPHVISQHRAHLPTTLLPFFLCEGARATTPMVTRGARIMAVATFASMPCCSFLHGGSRIVRMSARAGRHFALHSSSQVEQSTTGQKGAKCRANADDASFDTSLISTDPGLVLDHLKARRMGEESLNAVARIGGVYRCVQYIDLQHTILRSMTSHIIQRVNTDDGASMVAVTALPNVFIILDAYCLPCTGCVVFNRHPLIY